jgi:two-component sensor histidine kinase
MKSTLLAIWPRTRYPALLRYGVTLGIVGVCFLVRLATEHFLTQSPLLLFIPAVFLASILFGAPTGMVATFASDLLAAKYLVSLDQPGVPILPSLVSLGLFTAIGFLISGTIEKLHEAVRELRHAEAEKSLLLEELNHRTRNDLMMVSSALSLQAKKVSDPAAQAALKAAISRVAVIAKAQERLGTTREHRGQVQLSGFLEALCHDLGALLLDVRPIAVRVKAQPLEVKSSEAVAIGLIVNELVTNAFKYAFPGELGGAVDVTLHRVSNGLRISVHDNGVGCPKESNASGTGSRLVQLIAAQHGGRVEREPVEKGCCVCVWLPIATMAV